jgi:hypothetical protein
MPKSKMVNIHKFKDGKLRVYKQSSTKNWYARFYTEGKYKVRSLGTTSFNTAKTIAQDWYDDLRYSQKHGNKIHGILFKDVVPDFLKYQQVLVKGGELSKDMAKDYKWRVNAEKGIFSYWKDTYIQDISLQTLNSYKEKRIISDGVKHTTISHEFGTLRQVLKYCILQQYIKGLPEFPKKSKKNKPNPRPYFEKDEWQLLQNTSRDRIKNARGIRVRNSRECLHDFMMFMVHTGMRVDEVYRTTFGIGNENDYRHQSGCGYCYTMDEDIALWFAHRLCMIDGKFKCSKAKITRNIVTLVFNDEGIQSSDDTEIDASLVGLSSRRVVAKYSVKKKNILFYVDNMSEREIVDLPETTQLISYKLSRPKIVPKANHQAVLLGSTNTFGLGVKK